MARTTPALVAALLGMNYDRVRTPDLNQFIAPATMIVDQIKAKAAVKGVAYTDSANPGDSSQLETIERWLAAHYYAQQDPLYTSRSTQGATGSFQVGQLGKGFASTQYGANAMDLDFSGVLKNINGQQKARGAWLGRRR